MRDVRRTVEEFVNDERHAGERYRFTYSLSVLPTSQVVYQETCGLFLLYNDSEDARFFVEFTATINYS